MKFTAHRIRQGFKAAAFFAASCFRSEGTRVLQEVLARRDEEKFRTYCGDRVPTVSASQLFPGIEDREVTLFTDSRILLRDTFVPESTSLLFPREIFFLSSLAHLLEPQNVFELGTFRGGTAYLFALNTPPTTKIYTLDIERRTDRIDTYRDDDSTRKIVFLEGDARKFSFDQWKGRCDLVFVDGDHTAEGVCRDTAIALSLIHDRGVVVWHDFTPRWAGVVAEVLKVAASRPVYRLEGTRLAVHTSRFLR